MNECSGECVSYIRHKRPRSPNDEFFEEGNAVILKMSPEYIAEEFLIDEENGFVCSFFGCSSVFSTLSAYELHYKSRHRHECSQCSRCFPSAFLLDTHLVECHDAYFAVQSKEKPMYNCLVENCKEMFWTPKERKRHLIRSHKFPKGFRSELLIGNRKRRGRRKRIEAEKGKQESIDMELDGVNTRFKYAYLEERVPKEVTFGRRRRGGHRGR